MKIVIHRLPNTLRWDRHISWMADGSNLIVDQQNLKDYQSMAMGVGQEANDLLGENKPPSKLETPIGGHLSSYMQLLARRLYIYKKREIPIPNLNQQPSTYKSTTLQNKLPKSPYNT